MKESNSFTPLITRPHMGILGGGQLARLMALEAHRLGLKVHIFCHHGEEPAAQVAPYTVFSRKKRLYFTEAGHRVLKTLTHLTFESEFFDLTQLRLETHQYTQLTIYPDMDIMAQLQQRIGQKSLLDQYRLPTSPWVSLTHPQDYQGLAQKIKPPLVYKKNQGGYDGLGTLITSDTSPLPGIWIAEKKIPFRRELAVTALCPQMGEIQFYPLVETHQIQSRCDSVWGPAQHPAWSKLQRKISRFLKSIGYQGVIAFEMFDVDDQTLVINEIAPRVHNSSHYTQNSFVLNQFAAHLLCALPDPLPKLKLQHPSFAMINLIGKDDGQWSLDPQHGHIHWYGKTEKLGRKLGHLNLTSSSLKPLTLRKLGLRERQRLLRSPHPQKNHK